MELDYYALLVTIIIVEFLALLMAWIALIIILTRSPK